MKGAREGDWDNVSHHVKARRVFLKKTVTKALAKESGVSAKTWDALDQAKPVVSLAKRQEICEALHWGSESFDLMLDGEEPTELPIPRGGRRRPMMTPEQLRLDRLEKKVDVVIDVIEKNLGQKIEIGGRQAPGVGRPSSPGRLNAPRL